MEPKRTDYISLIQKYLNGEIDEKTYGTEFQELLARHTALENEKIASWPERYDRQIERDYYAGKIALDERNRRWKDLWGENPKWYDVVYLDLVYLGDRRTENEEVLRDCQNDPDEYKRTYFLTEEQLKEELKKYLRELESSPD